MNAEDITVEVTRIRIPQSVYQNSEANVIQSLMAGMSLPSLPPTQAPIQALPPSQPPVSKQPLLPPASLPPSFPDVARTPQVVKPPITATIKLYLDQLLFTLQSIQWKRWGKGGCAAVVLVAIALALANKDTLKAVDSTGETEVLPVKEEAVPYEPDKVNRAGTYPAFPTLTPALSGP